MEPYNLSIDAIGKLTPYQLSKLLFCPRDATGKALPEPYLSPAVSLSSFDYFKRHLQLNGITDEWAVAKLWKLQQKEATLLPSS